MRPKRGKPSKNPEQSNKEIAMRQIASAQFMAEVQLDPAWASKLTEPVEITDYCYMGESEITHLSPLLHFTGKNNDGNSANFYGCASLKIAEGNSKGFLNFLNSGIEEIRNLTCGRNKYGHSADFSYCDSLKVARGRFKGAIDLSNSSIEEIRDLSCGKNYSGIRLNVENCPKLVKIPLTFNPKEVKADSKLLEKLEVDRFIQKRRKEIVEIEI